MTSYELDPIQAEVYEQYFTDEYWENPDGNFDADYPASNAIMSADGKQMVQQLFEVNNGRLGLSEVVRFEGNILRPIDAKDSKESKDFPIVKVRTEAVAIKTYPEESLRDPKYANHN